MLIWQQAISKEMEKEAESTRHPRNINLPLLTMLKKKTMGDMNTESKLSLPSLKVLELKILASTFGTYFMEEHSISTEEKFTAVWIPTYGYNDGYYNAAPNTEQPYDLHQCLPQRGKLEGFPHNLDLNQLSPVQDKETYKNYFQHQNKKLR